MMFRLHNTVITLTLCSAISLTISNKLSASLSSKSSLIEEKTNQEDVAGLHSNTLDIHLAMESGSNPTNLRSMVRDEMKSIIKDSRNSIAEDSEERSPIALRSLKYDFEKNDVALKFDNINAKMQVIESILRDIQNKSDTCSSMIEKYGSCSNDENFLGVRGTRPSSSKNPKDYPKNCKEALHKGNNVSGVYEIFPKYFEAPFSVLCDMEVRGGGWTHIQKRFDGSQDFFLDWRDYKFGFGNIHGEFWLGLQKIYLLSGFEPTELLVEIVDRDNVSAFAHYTSFAIGSEPGGYKLDRLSGFSGDAGDSLTHHLGSKFSTKDLDFTKDSCPTVYFGAWWYTDCHISNLNGKYINIDLPEKYKFKGMHWRTFRSHEYCHAKARMLVRPLN